jgi:hypothetical protein
MSVKKLINESAKMLRDVMQMGLEVAADEMISSRVKEFEQTSVSNELKGLNQGNEKGMMNYRNALKDALTIIADDALKGAKREIKGVKYKFGKLENLETFDSLPLPIRRRVDAQAALLARTHYGDLEKSIDFQYLHSVPATESGAIIRADLKEAAKDYIQGPATLAGSITSSSTMVNETRNELFFEPDVLEQIEAFEFMNGDPVSEVCQNLAGTIFEKDDPEASQFYPPLHFNCKSWIRPLLTVPKGKEIVRLEPSTQAARNSIQFSDLKHCCPHHNNTSQT